MLSSIKKKFQPVDFLFGEMGPKASHFYLKDCHEGLESLGLPAETTPWVQPVPGSLAVPLSGFAQRAYLGVLPKKKPLLESGSSMGPWHRAQWLGAQVALRLLAESLFPPEAPIALTVSPVLKSWIEVCPEGFVCGLIVKLHKLLEAKGCGTKTLGAQGLSLSQEAIQRGQVMAQSIILARRLVHTPPNLLNPRTYAALVQELSTQWNGEMGGCGTVSARVWSAQELTKDGCGLLLAVGQGSAIEPCLVELTYTPNSTGPTSLHVALVGKGVTFDSGGLDLKPGQFMRHMKKDMGGSAAVLGAFHSLALGKFSGKVSCFLALAENMPSHCSMRPGDVYTSRKGLQVEITDTDAEGRLVLADALDMALDRKPDCIVDVATLTGAARVALGGQVDGLFSNHPKLRALFEQESVSTGDWVWPIPLCPEYDKMLESSVADLANCAQSGHGGAITAALFLQKFVNETPWVHLDSYMWSDKTTDFYNEAGPTGKCVVLINQVLKGLEAAGGAMALRSS